MKILFVFSHIGVAHNLSFPFGLATLISYIQSKGFEVDLAYITSLNEGFRELKTKIRHFRPDIVAYSSVSSQYPYIERIARRLRVNKEIYQVCGGVHISLNPCAYNADSPFDAIIVGEGEYSLSELICARHKNTTYSAIPGVWVKNENEKVVANPNRPFIKNIDNLPFPNRILFDYQKIINADNNSARFIFSRGCPFACAYCSNKALSKLGCGKYFRIRSVEKALEELDFVLGRYNATSVQFDDDILTLNKKWFHYFINEYKKYVALPFACNVRPGTCDPETLLLLKDAGCQIVGMGIECGDDEYRFKFLNRKIGRTKLIKSLTSVNNAGMRLKTYNLLGLPEETPRHFLETIRINAMVQPSLRSLNVYYPYRNTWLGEYAFSRDMVKGNKADRQIERMDSILKDTWFPSRLMNYIRDRFDELVDITIEKNAWNELDRETELEAINGYVRQKQALAKYKRRFQNLIMENILATVVPDSLVHIHGNRYLVEDVTEFVRLLRVRVIGHSSDNISEKMLTKLRKTSNLKVLIASEKDEIEAKNALNDWGIEYVELLSGLREGKNQNKNDRHGSGDDITAVICTVGENTLPDCLRSIENQILQPGKIEIIRDIAPMSQAFNEMLARVSTRYFVHVDADMILAPDCVEEMYKAIRQRDTVFMSSAYLKDDLVGKIPSIKMFDRNIIANTRYRDIIGCDRDFEARVMAQGFSTVTLNRTLGRHLSGASKKAAFQKYKRTMEKCRLLNDAHEPFIQAIIDSYYKERPAVTTYALAGLFAGLYSEDKKSAKEKSFKDLEKDIYYQKADRFLMGAKSRGAYLEQQASFFRNQNLLNTALHFYKTLIKEDPAVASKVWEFGIRLKKEGLAEDASKFFLSVLEKRDCLDANQIGHVCFELGEIFYNEEDNIKARKYFMDSLAATPDNLQASTYLQRLDNTDRLKPRD